MSVLVGKRVLILEDEPIIAFVLEDMIESLGCVLAGVAHSLPVALELVERLHFDAAVLDVNVAGELSYRVADALADKGVPFLFATGYGETAHPEAFRSALTLAKPYTTDAVASSLAALLSGSSKR